MVNIKARTIQELKSIYEEFRSLIASLIDISKKNKLSTILLLVWIISIPLLFYFLNSLAISNELLRIELPLIFSWGPILLSIYQGIIHLSD